MGYINSYLGLDLAPQQIADLLSRMALVATPSADGTAVHIEIPPTRSDVLQDVDVVEVILAPSLRQANSRCLGLFLLLACIVNAMRSTPSRETRGYLTRLKSRRPETVHVPQDVAIAFGYNNMPRQVPSTSTFGREQALNQLSEALRLEIRDYTESLTWTLCSRAENFDQVGRKDDGMSAVSIGNPATAEFEVCRTTLLPGKQAFLSFLQPPVLQK